jgi:lauroyl/myristoyl acyltransferase
MLLILKPAADYLPLRWALGLANWLGVVADITIMHDGQRARANMKGAFNLSDEDAVQAARQWLANQFCDYVVLRRVGRGREDPAKWRVIQKNVQALEQLHESGKPFILATGQFTRRAHVPFFTSMIAPARIVAAVQPLPKGWSPRAIRVRTQVAQARKGFKGARAGKLEIIVIGQQHTLDLDEYLRHPYNILYVTVDAHWPAKRWAYHRPFAGYPSFSFTTGPATLARLTQCPILPCLPFVDGSGAVVLEWGDVIPPPPLSDVDADVRITDELIDRIERAIGSRPTQYVNAPGRWRRWNGDAGRWEDLDPGSTSTASVRFEDHE